MMRMTDEQRLVGERLPLLYGVAYYDFAMNSGVYYPIPLNLLVRFLRGLWMRIKAPDRTWWEERERVIRDRAYQEAIKVVDAKIRHAFRRDFGRSLW